MSHTAVKHENPAEYPQPGEPRQRQANDMPVGEILRRARLHYGLSLQDVESVLRIKAMQLDAIEKGHHEFLPARVYAIGFVRSYAQYLGLDDDHVVRLFKQQSIASTPNPDLNFPVGVEQSTMPSWWIVVLSLALLVVAPIIWFQALDSEPTAVADADIPPISSEVTEAAIKDPAIVQPSPVQTEAQGIGDIEEPISAAPEPQAPAQAQEQPAPKASQQAQPQESAAAPAPAPAQQEGVVLTILENSWVEIQNAEGKRLVSRVLKEGEQYFVPDRPGLTMSIGNAGGVEIGIGEETIPPLGERGAVIRDIPLKASVLKTLAKER